MKTEQVRNLRTGVRRDYAVPRPWRGDCSVLRRTRCLKWILPRFVCLHQRDLSVADPSHCDGCLFSRRTRWAHPHAVRTNYRSLRLNSELDLSI